MSVEAHARRSDPQTSHQAAAFITPRLTELHRLVQRYARTRRDGFTDRELTEQYPHLGPSTLRTRRAELCARNIILDSMRRRRPADGGQPHTVWIHRDFVDSPPDITEPVAPATKEDRAEASVRATTLDGFAKSMRAEGRSFMADELERCAILLRKLSA